MQKEDNLQKGKTADELDKMNSYTVFHTCGGVAQLFNMCSTATPGVQVNMHDVDRIVNAAYPESGTPDRIVHSFVVNITEDSCPAMS